MQKKIIINNHSYYITILQTFKHKHIQTTIAKKPFQGTQQLTPVFTTPEGHIFSQCAYIRSDTEGGILKYIKKSTKTNPKFETATYTQLIQFETSEIELIDQKGIPEGIYINETKNEIIINKKDETYKIKGNLKETNHNTKIEFTFNFQNKTITGNIFDQKQKYNTTQVPAFETQNKTTFEELIQTDNEIPEPAGYKLQKENYQYWNPKTNEITSQPEWHELHTEPNGQQTLKAFVYYPNNTQNLQIESQLPIKTLLETRLITGSYKLIPKSVNNIAEHQKLAAYLCTQQIVLKTTIDTTIFENDTPKPTYITGTINGTTYQLHILHAHTQLKTPTTQPPKKKFQPTQLHPQVIIPGQHPFQTIQRDIWIQETKTGKNLKKIIIRQYSKETQFPFLISLTDYNPNKLTPLEITTKFANTENRKNELYKILLKNIPENYKKYETY